MKTLSFASVISVMALVLVIALSASFAYAARGSGSGTSLTERAASTNDDGTADQGRGDVAVNTPSTLQVPATAPTTMVQADTLVLEVEADVFTDITVVKVELNDVKHFYLTSTKTRAVLVPEVATHFGLSTTQVDRVMVFEIEDRASRTKDRQ